MGHQTSPPVPPVMRTNEPGIHDSSQRPGVMARLHALFPSHTVESTQDSRRPPPKFLKVRMLTWNMHDSLPKGDLDDLLGPIYDYGEQETTPGALPDLPLTSQHPYHLIVVAGQECPSVSGIPMALGAGFKLKDKEKEREKSKEKEKDMSGEQHPDLEKSRDEDEDRRKSRHLSMRRLSHRPQNEEDELITSASASTHDLLLSHHPPYGWTSMLEDWFCNGVHATTPVHPTTQDPGTDIEPRKSDEVPIPPKAKSTGDLSGRIQPLQKGPYELLIKERMMGLYLAVFIKRDVRNLVRGMSKSSVTAGLIGGRVGNKGGVGISLNLHGTTFLFLNAHLAAHEGKMQHRLANLTKIKSELTVDTFLAPDDPRMMAEDITDRFDFAFICGDLNFRLDVTRLHADWLISRREYAQALAFDQLRKAMETGVAFVGFNEAPIDFPPTFKYDVLRSKRSKHRSLKRISRNLGIDGTQHDKLLTEIEEHGQDAEEEKSDDEPEYDGEAASVTSTNYTQYTTDGEDQERDQEDDFVGTSIVRTSSVSNLTNKEWYNAAAQKAKTKWISLLSTSVPKTPMGKWAKFKNRQSGMSNSSYDPSPSPSLTGSPAPEFKSTAFPPTPDLSEGGKELDGRNFAASRSGGGSSEIGRLSAPITIGGRTNSTKSTARSEDRDHNEEAKFNYDSSHKKRVPSWCDRILWKSTVQPPLEPIEEDDEPPPLPPRRRMGSLLSALRPASLRSRKDSTASTDITPTSPYHTDDAASSRSSPHDIDSNGQAALESPSTPRSRPLSHSKSIEFTASSDRPFMNRSKSHMLLREERARKPSLPSLANIRPPTLPPSRPQELKDMLAAASSSKEMLPSPAPTTSLWRNLSLFPFLSRDNTPQNTPTDRPLTPESPTPPDPQKGDVVCLSYDTLDDMAMRRLQAKSDHRPVIGTYAIYV